MSELREKIKKADDDDEGRELRRLIASAGRAFSQEDEAAFNLWDWLPSHARAVMAHGDYAGEFQPGLANIMGETILVISSLRGYGHNKAELVDWFRCPCDDGDCYIATEKEDEFIEWVKSWFVSNFGGVLVVTEAA